MDFLTEEEEIDATIANQRRSHEPSQLKDMETSCPIYSCNRKIASGQWSSNQMQQDMIDVDIQVYERLSPTYGFLFSFATKDSQHTSLVSCERQVSVQDIANVVKFTQKRESGAFYWITTSENGRSVDAEIQAWISKGKMPKKTHLAIWLLDRLVLMENKTGVTRYKPVLFGESGAEKPTTIVPETLDDNEVDELPGYESPKKGQASIARETDDELPGYESPKRKRDPEIAGRESMDGSLVDSSKESVETNPTFKFEPAVVRQQETMSQKTQHWSNDRWRIRLEVEKSKRDIEECKELQRRHHIVKQIRLQRLMADGGTKRREDRLAKQDREYVKNATGDAIEYHDILYSLETKTKQLKIAAMREQERMSRALKVGRREKWVKGPVLGPGPLPVEAMNALRKQTGPPVYVYDIHGRKHRLEEAGEVAKESALASCLEKLRRAAETSTVNGIDLFRPFRKYDYDRSGTLSRHEFADAVAEMGAKLTAEQFTALYEHFDPNDSGGIDYGELMWGFFNRRVFLKRWKLRKKAKSEQEIHDMFNKYDRTGRGALNHRDFIVVLKELKFQVNAFEEKLLMERFDRNRDGFIDYYEFENFIRSEETPEPKNQRPLTQRTNISPEITEEIASTGDIQSYLNKIETIQNKLRRSIPSKYFQELE